MPAPEVRALNDYAVLWAAGVTDGYGRSKVLAPIEIKVRWEGSIAESTSSQDTVQSQPAEVFVDREVTIGSILWHGRLANLPESPTGLKEVTGYEVTPDIKNRFMQRTVTLTRYSDSLPTVD
jgi:hypothetical protein